MSFNKILTTLIVIVIVVLGFFYFKSYKAQAPTTDQTQTSSQSNDQTTAPAADNTSVPDKAVATIDTSMGSFEVTLDGKAAPKTMANFIKLANQGFYNNLKFHRIVAGFMIQGGDPSGDGTGGPGYTIPAEIGLKHTIGAIAMARTGDQVNPNRESSGSQFYVTLAAQPSLDGLYTVFGYVTSGMEVVTKIGLVATDVNPATGEQSVPIKDVVINKITIK